MNSIIDKTYDMIVIGGGAVGSGIALDASSRGYNVLLLEKNDFASGSSSKSSKLIHGGVRYLEKAIRNLDKKQYDLVKEALYERALFIKNAPHLAKKLKLDTPIYKNIEILYTYLGLLLYKLIAGSKSLGNNSFINKTLLCLLQPNIKKEELKGAISFYDGRFLDSRMVIALLQSAQEYGAEVKNYNEVENFIYDNKNKIIALKYKDKINNEYHEVKANCIINATGANVDNLRLLDNKTSENILRLSSGTHIIIDKKFLPNDEGILIPETLDGRVIFVLPYLGKCLVGTTDNNCEYVNNPKASKEDIKYLLGHINDFFEVKVKKSDILSSWCGLRPLVKESADGILSENLVREHLITESTSGLISIAGGKWTTYRLMSEDLVNYVISNKYLNKRKVCRTKKLKLVGSQSSLKKTSKKLKNYKILEKTKKSLIMLYGNRVDDIIEIAYKYNAFELIHKELPYIKAEIIYSIKHEFAKRPIDFLARRISLCFLDKQKALESVHYVNEVMKVQFLWDEEKVSIELEQSKNEIERFF